MTNREQNIGGGEVVSGMDASIYDAAVIAEQVVGLLASQTLENKTLVSPVINSPLGIVKGDVGLGGVDNTSDSTKNAATATVTNKTIDADSNTLLNLLAEEGLAVVAEDLLLAVATAKRTFRMPYAMTLTEVRASVSEAPTGSGISVDINEGGVSRLSTKLTIDATEKTSKTALVPAVISGSALADDAEITIDIDAIGSTTAGKGLKIYLIGKRA